MDDVNAVPPIHDQLPEANIRCERDPLGNAPPPGLSEAAKRWTKENSGSIQAWNDWIEQNGLPFDDLRRG